MAKRISFPGAPACMAIAAVLIVGLAATGCGSKSSSKTSAKPAAAITKADFLAKGNAICNKGNKELNALGAKLGKKATKAQFTAAAKNSYVPSIQAQIDGIRALGAPSGDEATVKKFLDLAQADLNRIKGKPSLLFGNTRQFADFAKIAHPYGLKACAPNN